MQNFESNGLSILLPRWGLLCFPASLSAFQVLLELQLVSCSRCSTTFQLDKNCTSNNAMYSYHQVLVFLVCPLPFLSRSATGYFRSHVNYFPAFRDQTFQPPYSWKLQGIAGGTFLYITFFEVLPHELNIPSKRLWKVCRIITSYQVSEYFHSGIFCHLGLCRVLCHPHWTWARTWTWAWTCTSTPRNKGNVERII